MRLLLSGSEGDVPSQLPSRAAPFDVVLRSPLSTDVAALGRLMYVAYQGTVDYEGETEADACGEIARTLGGEYGPLNVAASQVCEVAGEIRSAALITTWRSKPLLAYSLTHPASQKQGLATRCLHAACTALRSQGLGELRLVVTLANEPALKLYRKLGFQMFEAES